MKKPRSKILIGSREWCAFPDLGIGAVKAKVDSGAKTSSLHAFELEVFDRQGEPWVRFEIHPLQKNQRVKRITEAPVIDQRWVRSSSGEAEERYVISSQLRMGGHSWPVELTLTNRDSMGYRMLLGREAMRGRMLIDPDAAYLMGKISQAELERLYSIRLTRRGRTKSARKPLAS